MGDRIKAVNPEKVALRKAWIEVYPRDSKIRAQLSQRVCERLVALPEFRKARQISLYAGRDWEIDLLPLLTLFPRIYAFPKVDTKLKAMEFYEISKPGDLIAGTLGILEPETHRPVQKWTAEDLVLVPGYAFDVFGTRIGSGGGYYDRFFPRFPAVRRWGIGFEAQFHPKALAHLEHDVRMDAVCTDSGFFPAKKVETS